MVQLLVGSNIGFRDRSGETEKRLLLAVVDDSSPYDCLPRRQLDTSLRDRLVEPTFKYACSPGRLRKYPSTCLHLGCDPVEVRAPANDPTKDRPLSCSDATASSHASLLST